MFQEDAKRQRQFAEFQKSFPDYRAKILKFAELLEGAAVATKATLERFEEHS
jgi:hypothetical protein